MIDSDKNIALRRYDQMQSASLPAQQRRELTRKFLEENYDEKDTTRERAILDLQDWMEKPPVLKLFRNDQTKLHNLKRAVQTLRLIDGVTKSTDYVGREYILEIEHTFVVKHDWAEAFKDADIASDTEVKFPYDVCAFEFRLDGRTVILLRRDMGVASDRYEMFIECGDFWYTPPPNYGKEEFVRYLWIQVHAICIALDVEIAEHSVVRAPLELNDKRDKQGKPRISDYHVVDLARRIKIQNPLEEPEGEGSKKRMHFRRGHWRRYDDHKTWIRWCLVGDPDLGFIRKHYTI
jgi:hypothetical protein